ncbi:phosphatidylinositol 4-phosphate 3-kinase C2 domain-containing subunit beta [Bacillus rossius redtenbacheri]|uniref:phosphatidylinositol 4-phosphate 3-kinase C2 domain-containing subunit beta n=1 Tax=Bacillus rossius redtenbacheri TaxID=93214 RepID=UPI002FDCD536
MGEPTRPVPREPDYERQFQEDLERALSLSLESLALDNFRLKRRQNCSSPSGAGSGGTADRAPAAERVAKVDLKSRPRPGSFNTGGSRLSQMIAPPPAVQRRGSSASSTLSTPEPPESDLISFNCPCPAERRKHTTTVLLNEPRYGATLPYRGGVLHIPPGCTDYKYAGATPPYSARPSLFLPHVSSTSVGGGYRTIVPVNTSAYPLPVAETAGEPVVPRLPEKRDDNNLIDLTPFDQPSLGDASSSRVSVLEAFDPLLNADQPALDAASVITKDADEVDSQWSGSVYDPYDPFDYMYAQSGEGSQCDPVYAAVVKERSAPLSPCTPPPLPPRNSAAWSTIERRRSSLDRKHKVKSRLYENVKLVKQKGETGALHDPDLQAFYKMVRSVRAEFPHDDPLSNPGIVTSPIIESSCVTETSVKLVVHSEEGGGAVTFTCDLGSTVEHVVLHVVCELEGDLRRPAADYLLKVHGLQEFLVPETSLADYEYVHQCTKLERDVELCLVPAARLGRPLARTAQDDVRDSALKLQDLLPNEPVDPMSYDSLMILLETMEQEMERATQATGVPGATVRPERVVQGVKAICALMGSVETTDISEAVEGLRRACQQLAAPAPPFTALAEGTPWLGIASESKDYCNVTLKRPELSARDTIAAHCDRIRDSVQGLIETYCQAFRVDFQLQSRAEMPANKRQSCDVLDSVLVHVGALHRPLQGWTHSDFVIAGQIYHGTRPVGQPALCRPVLRSRGFYDRVVFDFWLNFETTSVCMLPRESRLVLVLYGRTELPPETDSKEERGEPRMLEVELGWAATQFFNYEGVMAQGSYLLSLWPAVADKRLGPAPAPGTHPHGDSDPVLWVEFPDYGGCTVFPSTKNCGLAPTCDFNSLDPNTQQQLLDITEQDAFTRPLVEDREVLWEKRHYLHDRPGALPKVLLAAHSWDWACLRDLHATLHSWSPLPPVGALQLLLPCFPDAEVRRMAVTWIGATRSDELVDLLPQLVQALKSETWEASPLAQFLLRRSLGSPRVAHHLYWLLVQALPGQFPQNSSEQQGEDDASLSAARYHRRLQLMLRALLATTGEALRQRFLSQQLLVRNLYEAAESVKATKEALRLTRLTQELEPIHHALHESPTCLPLSPSLEVGGLLVRGCSYFPSNTLPLRLAFLSPSGALVPAIFKVGDDLQQDMLVLQMVRIMDKLWLKEGLDLKMVTFSCVPTGHKRGMIEMVTNAETLRKIQVELGLTGSFKDRPIAEWLAKHNPSTLEYERAVENFTASCAGYSVATYILGICDRHNDNIMLKTSGHLFHIDFGKFLGDAQMFGNFKRDRTPFVLTSDMAYVINGGDKPSAKFHHFVDLCCQAFNVVRKHGNLLLNLFCLMVSSGIPGVTMEAVSYVQRALSLELSRPEAAAMFARMIEGSLKSWFTQFNFFLHNLAQLRFSGDHDDGELLSFIPRTYTLQQEGRIRSVAMHGYQKRYDPEKYYVYILRVERENQPDPVYLFRSYKEFCELHQKLCILFPLAKCSSLPSGISIGRSNIKQVAEKRRGDVERFLNSLFAMADEIAHSDLVYTFFHPLLRDQQEEINIYATKVRERKSRQQSGGEAHLIRGQLKLSLQHSRGALQVMVHHARGLPLVAGGQEPSAYVKVYLLPDPAKLTKRKTRVVRRNCHPSFMETLEYRSPLEAVRRRVLQATVWNHDSLQENEFLGCVALPLESMDLSSETTEWYSLGNMVSR